MSGSIRRATSTGSSNPESSPRSCSRAAKSMLSSAFRRSRRNCGASKVGHVIVNSTVDRPWSQYFCCMLSGNSDFVRRVSGCYQACAARHPQGGGFVHRRAGPGRRALGRGRVHRQLRYALAGTYRGAIPEMAGLRFHGHRPFLFAAASRGRYDQVHSAEIIAEGRTGASSTNSSAS